MLYYPKILFSLSLLIGIFHIGHSQIINVESQRIITDTTGWSGTAGISMAANKFTKSFFAFSVNGHLQHKTERDLWLAIVDYDVINAGGERFNNSGFGHVRFNRKLSEIIRLEVFSQLQYNSITKIDVRYLNGLGLRFKLSPYENAKFYFGTSYMYEYENILNLEEQNRDHRSSNYLTFTLTPESAVSFINTTYAQPKIGDINDYRINNDTRLIFSVTDQLKFNANIHFLYDSRPPLGIPSVNYTIRNGLTYKF